MEAEHWALLISTIGLVGSVVTLWLAWRWRRAGALLELHERLRELKAGALEHLDVYAGDAPTESDLARYRERAEIMAHHAPWKDVRRVSERVLEECNAVMVPRVREAQIERKDEIRAAIQNAFETATTTIGRRWGRLRG